MIISPLTNESKQYTNFTMAGTIRTKERCPKCLGKFQGNPLQCPTCLIPPKRYFLDTYWKKRLKIYSTRDGVPLDSWARASRLMETIRGEIDRKIFDPKDYRPDRKTFLSFEVKVKEWLEGKERRVKKGDLAPSYTKELKRYVETYYTPFFKKIDITEIRTGHVEDFYHSIPEHLSAKTVKNILNALQNFFFEMHRKEYINRCPLFPQICPPEPEWCWIDENVQDTLIKAIPEQHRPIFLFMARQAVRPGEARALQWEDVDFEKEIVTIRRTFSLDKVRNFTKTKRIRYLPLHPDVLASLRANRGISGFVFRNHDRPYSTSVLWYHWKEAKEKVGIKGKLRLYDGTRHSVASQAVNRGVDLNLIGKVLGHSKNDMTNRYAHIMTETLKKVIVSPVCPPGQDSKDNLLKIKKNN